MHHVKAPLHPRTLHNLNLCWQSRLRGGLWWPCCQCSPRSRDSWLMTCMQDCGGPVSGGGARRLVCGDVVGGHIRLAAADGAVAAAQARHAGTSAPSKYGRGAGMDAAADRAVSGQGMMPDPSAAFLYFVHVTVDCHCLACLACFALLGFASTTYLMYLPHDFFCSSCPAAGFLRTSSARPARCACWPLARWPFWSTSRSSCASAASPLSRTRCGQHTSHHGLAIK